LGFGPPEVEVLHKKNIENQEIQKLFPNLKKGIKAILGQFGKMHARY